MKTGFFIPLLISILNGILGSFPFDLDNISDADEKSPQISFLSLDSSSQRPIGEFPPEFKKRPQVSSVTAPSPSPSFVASTKIISKNNSSFDAPVAKKRRVNFKAITPDMTVEEIIETEIKECGFMKAEKISQYRKTLQLIAQNDREAFDEDEVNFKALFKHKTYISFKKDNADFYLLRFMIMFGADKLINRNVSCISEISDISHRFSEAFNYFLKTKPINEVISFFGLQMTFTIESETHAKMIQAVKEQYPNLPYLKIFFFESLDKLNSTNLFFDAFLEDDERTAFRLMVDSFKYSEALKIQCFSSFKFHKIPLRLPEYYLELDDASKFRFLKVSLVEDDVETFEELINLDYNIILHINVMTSEYIESKKRAACYADTDFDPVLFADDRNIFHEAIYFSAKKCIRFLIDVAPELLFASTSTMDPAIKSVFYKIDTNLYDLFYEEGYTEFKLIKTFDGKEYNLIQYAFFVHSLEAIKYFISKVGNDVVKKEIKKIWGTTEEILVHILNVKMHPRYASYLRFIFNLFGFNPNSNYRYKDKEGNILIFVEKTTHCTRILTSEYALGRLN